MEEPGPLLKFFAVSVYKVTRFCHFIVCVISLHHGDRHVTRKSQASRHIYNPVGLSQWYQGTPDYRKQHLTIPSCEFVARTEFRYWTYQ